MICSSQNKKHVSGNGAFGRHDDRDYGDKLALGMSDFRVKLDKMLSNFRNLQESDGMVVEFSPEEFDGVVANFSPEESEVVANFSSEEFTGVVTNFSSEEIGGVVATSRPASCVIPLEKSEASIDVLAV